MDRLGVQMRTWVLLVTLGCTYLGQAMAEPHYLVAIPALLSSGDPARFCVRLLQPNESLMVTVTLMTAYENITLYRRGSAQEFADCDDFDVPVVPEDVVQDFAVEVTGATFYSREVRKVFVQVNKPVSFIQTDKPIYLPGQTVHFRVVSLDTKLRPTCRKYDMIELEDTHRNRIGQWLNHTSSGKILQLSYPLNPEVTQGTFRLTVTSGDDKIYHDFKVEKYVLPKFEVTVTTDNQASVAQQDISVKVCAKYTYGQPVPGTVKLEVCRPMSRYYYGSPGPEGPPQFTAPCVLLTQQAEGCATFTVPMSTFTKIDPKALQDTLEVIAKMEEEGTGIVHSQSARVEISYVIGKLSFFDTPKVYDKDSVIEGKVKAVRYDDTPLANMDLYLFLGERWSSDHLQNLTTDNNGVASFTFNTAGYSGNLHFHISEKYGLEYPGYRVPYHETGEVTVSMAQQASQDTKTVSSLRVERTERTFLCGTEEDIVIHFTLVREAPGPMDIMYWVVGNNGISKQGQERVLITDKTVTEGSVSLRFPITAATAPDFTVVAYAVLPSSYVIAHSQVFQNEKCFSHKVGVQFNPDQGVPGEAALLQVTGQPSSLCGMSVIDQSVLIQEPGKHLKAEQIYDLLPRTRYIPYQAQDPTNCLPVRPRRSIMPYPPYHGNRDDAFTVFSNAGLKVLTNLKIRVPDCLTYMGREYHFGSFPVAYNRMEEMHVAMAVPLGGGVGAAGAGAPLSPIETVRTFFPETWIWDLVEIGPSGQADKAVKIPDTITTWETEAFCISSQGFGLAPRVNFTVFQPFFLELSLPYSSVRGEEFELKATVFNYLSSCIMVEVTPADSGDYTLTLLPGTSTTFCLCGNERKTVVWTMSPTTLGQVDVTVSAEAVTSDVSCNNEVVLVPERGRIDRVTRKLKVKAEGLEVMKTHNLLLCPKGSSVSEDITVDLPGNMIPDSARGLVSVIGDIMGRAMRNLDGLLQMPYGCGEQNMLLFAPNIDILDYLTKTQQLTPELEEKAKNFLVNGYQRQLNYKHLDGSYSAFGEGTGAGNTWLTAFVLRSFVKAQQFVFIDPAKIDESKQWLVSKQTPNGCFEKSGRLFHNQMKGGVSDEVTLSAYVTAALLEMKMPVDDPVLVNSLTCLREAKDVKTNTYAAALLSYVFTLAGDFTSRNELLNHLDTVAHKDGGLLHWSQTSASTSDSLSVEASSYVMLAVLGSHLEPAKPSAEQLGYATKITRWLVKQQNYYGGFSSTQDTVVALQALTRYSSLLDNPGGASTVTLRTQTGAVEMFEVNQQNKLLYQERTLNDITGTHSVTVNGQACAALQVTVFYNIPVPLLPSPFALKVMRDADCGSGLLRPRMNMKIKAMYKGEADLSNMVVVDVELLTGFSADEESLKTLRTVPLVERVDKDEEHILIYLDAVPKDLELSFPLEVVRERVVYNLKPAVVKIYDYYQPSDKNEVDYTYICNNRG